MPTVMRLPRGARPSPRHVLAAARPFIHIPENPAPDNFILWPAAGISMWGNDTHGDCVTVEEAFAKSVSINKFFTAQEVMHWAARHGVLDGAMIADVLDWMVSDGFALKSGVYDDGPKRSIDWTDRGLLANAAFNHGPVKIGVAADLLQGGDPVKGAAEGNACGWTLYGYPAGLEADHCTAICGVGETLAGLIAEMEKQQFNGGPVTVRPVDGMPEGPCVAMFTWGGIGIVDWQSFLNMCSEAWVRVPENVTGS